MSSPRRTAIGGTFVSSTVPEYPFFSATFQKLAYSSDQAASTKSGAALCSCRQTTSGASAAMNSAKPFFKTERRPFTFQEINFMAPVSRIGAAATRLGDASTFEPHGAEPECVRDD